MSINSGKFFKDYKLQIIFSNYTRNHVITYIKKVILEKLVRKIGASKCSYCDQTCHIERESKYGVTYSKFNMVSDMMFICPPVDYDIHVHSRSIPKLLKMF